MSAMDTLDSLFVFVAFAFQIVLVIHFALRKWRFETAMRYGWIVYALSLPAALFSVAQILGGKPWFFWIAGLLYLLWGTFGTVVEYVYRIEWRDPIVWPIFAPYLLLFFATSMFYWWPLARISWWLWAIFAVLYVVGTVLNVTSHERPSHRPPASHALA